MNSKKYLFAIVVMFTLLVSCQEKEVIEEEEIITSVSLRVENATNVELDSIISNDHYFGSLESGEISDYFEFDQIYQWPNVSCQNDEGAYIWDTGVDNIGFWISFYTEGNYTIVITGIAVTSPLLVEAYLKED